MLFVFLSLFCEVITINRKSFLAELDKLLTFMQDSDRETAISLYEKIFTDADNDEEVSSLLTSPTKQAVIIARTYNAKVRGKEQAFANAIYDTYDDVMSELGIDSNSEFEDAGSAAVEIDLPQTSAASKPVVEIDLSEASRNADLESEAEASAEVEPDASLQTSGTGPGSGDGNTFFFTGDDIANSPDGISISVGDTTVSITGDTGSANWESGKEASSSIPPEAPNSGELQTSDSGLRSEAPNSGESRTADSGLQTEAEVPVQTERKVSPVALIFYIIFAVPITAALVMLLLIPVVFFLAFAAALFIAGGSALSTAFGSFAVFADVMVVLGCALVILALGLLSLWISIWFVGGAIVGVINGVFKLGNKLCYREVPVK